MSGSYGVGTNYLGFSAGGSGAAGTSDFTIAALVQIAAGNNNAGFVGLYASTTLTRALFADTLRLYGVDDFSNGWGPASDGDANMSLDTWYLAIITKVGGSNTYEFSIWAYASDGSGTMFHGTPTGSSSHGDGSTITAVRLGANAIQSNGLIAVTGIWNRVLSQAERNSMKSNLLTSWRDVSGGQPTTLIDLENWNGTTGANVAIGSNTFSGVTGTVGSGANPPSFDFSLGGGPIIGNLGLPSETDIAQSLSRQKLRTLSITSETDTAQSTTRRKVRTLGLVTETDNPLTISAKKIRTLSFPTESDSPLPITRRKLRTIGIPSETDVGQSVGKRKLKGLGIPSETDSPLGFGTVMAVPLGLPSEADSALPMGRLKSRVLGIPSETCSAFALAKKKVGRLGLPVEFDLPLALVLADEVPRLPDLTVRTGLSTTTVTTAQHVLTIRTGG